MNFIKANDFKLTSQTNRSLSTIIGQFHRFVAKNFSSISILYTYHCTRNEEIRLNGKTSIRTNRVSGIGMAIGFVLRVCRLIDSRPKPINWSNSSPSDGRGGRISISTPCVRGCVCHQTARPCLKFRAIQPWNIDIPCQHSRIPQGRHQRTLFATDYIYRRMCTRS